MSAAEGTRKTATPKRPQDRATPKTSKDKTKEKVSKDAKAVPRSSAKADDKNSASAEKQANTKIVEAQQMGETSLDLSALDLTSLPKKLFDSQTTWNSLDIGFNKFDNWPDFPSRAASLTELNMSGNKILSFPPDLLVFANLTALSLTGNKIMFIPSCIKGLASLVKLEMANNQVASISSEFGNLQKLEELNLSGNPLQTLPAELGQLKFLEILDVSGCQLIQLPDQFTNLVRLLDLNLGNNCLTELPENMGNISRLVALNLSDNQLRQLPMSLGACKSLDSCQIERNPIEDQELLKKYKIGTDHLKDYLEKKWFAIQQERKRESKAAEKKNLAVAKMERAQRLSVDAPRSARKTPENAETQQPVSAVQHLQLNAPKGRSLSVSTPTPRSSSSSSSSSSTPSSTSAASGPTPRSTPRASGANSASSPAYSSASSELKEREARYRLSTQKLVGDIRSEMVKIRKFMEMTTNIQEAVIVAKAMRDVIPHIEGARKILPQVAPLKPPQLQGNEDQITKLKKTTTPRLVELENVVDTMIVVVSAGAGLEIMLELSAFITPMLNSLQGTSQALNL